SVEYDRIAANFSWTTIQLLHLLLRPLWTRVFSGVDVRPEDIARIRTAMRDGAVILVPSHKSHFDYVLMSWVLYDHDLIVPHVVAGMNLAIWPISVLLRGAGGFFVKRSFSGDRLFPPVFARYLRELIRQEYPIEFFIEGGRTRSGKLLPPKVGVLSMVLDAAELRSHGREVTILPVALAYEQVAEEGAYARELGGEQKRPETLGQLLKARSVLSRRFGRVYLRIADPIPCGPLVDARDGVASWSETPEADRKQALGRLGNTIVRELGDQVVLLPTSLVALALLAAPVRAIRHGELLDRIRRLDALLRHLGVNRAASLDRFDQAITQALDRFVRDRRITPLDLHGERVWAIDPDQRITLDYAKNQVVHRLAPAGLVAAAIRPVSSGAVPDRPFTAAAIAERFRLLVGTLRREFIWDRDVDAILAEGLAHLTVHGALVANPDGTHAVADPVRIGELYGLVRSLLEGYLVVATDRFWPSTRDALTAAIHADQSALVAAGAVTRPESLSVVILQNAVGTYVDDGVLED
ncbi:MAG: 1-acyl-sn-glycerol-3-phosphate acyltransferase, partial [Myxococcota bacterium]